MEDGIVYDDLSDEDKKEYEDLFVAEDGSMPDRIDSSALNQRIFNEDTIRKVLNILMDKGIRVDYGNKIGKTIIFAKNHRHAEKIYEIFGKEYPNFPPNFCRVIDNYTNYAQSLIDEFSDPKKTPQIVVSVDMMDTGIDVPEVVNLVFFKKVMSKAKFWQMIGRGTRLCPGLLDGADKELFYIFDFCGNFEFFRTHKNGRDVPTTISVQQRIFNLKVNLVYKLQDLVYQTDELVSFRTSLIDELVEKVHQLNRKNFAVKQHLKFVDLYSDKENYEALTPLDIAQLEEEIAPLVLPYEDEISAVRFDALMYAIELGYIVGNTYHRGIKDLMGKVRAVATVSTIPAVTEKSEILDRILNTDYVERADINDFETIRKEIRDIIKYIPTYEWEPYITDFTDDIVNMAQNPYEPTG